MSIKETLEKIKPFYNLFLILVVASIFFALGRISVKNNENMAENKIKITNIEQKMEANIVTIANQEETNKNLNNSTSTTNTKTDNYVIGSKSGKKYYFPWCGTVKRIKPENQIRFNSIEEAKKSGFTPGGNCKGLY